MHEADAAANKTPQALRRQRRIEILKSVKPINCIRTFVAAICQAIGEVAAALRI
jgi:hypothetical protein